jgi:two-component system, chemotaxis family, chemotaxis protein CheY
MARRLLIADDALIIRRIIKDMATSAGWEVVGEASNGQEAIERYQELHPDAVTLDLVMPEHDGLHALHGIMELDPEAKVLVVSALEQRGVLKDAIRAGAADFVAKPFDKQGLQATLEQISPTTTV